jgi:hypothetical protein
MVERLGPLRLATAVEVTAEAGSGASETLAEQVGVEMARGGAYHAELLNSHDRGLEAFSIQGQLYVRLRYGELLRRRPQGDEAARLLETMHSRLFAPLELLGRFLRCVPAGDQELAGRPVRRFRLELATPPSPAVGEEGVAQRRWRQELHVTAASGELLVDARSFVLLRLKLAAAYQAPRSGQMISSRLQLNHQIEPLAEDPVLQPPPAVALDPRPRPALELRELLEGLVAPR